MTKVEFAGTIRGVEFRGVAEFHDGGPGEGPKLESIVWAPGADPGLTDEDEAWIEVEALAYNVLEYGPRWVPRESADVVW